MRHRVPRLVPVRFVPVLLVAALAGCGGGSGAGPGATAAAPPKPGERLYLQNCVACHQRTGEGVKGIQPSLVGTPVTVGDPEQLLAWTMFGTRPESLPKGEYRGVMPQFAYLSDADLAELATYIRTSWGNQASPVTPDLVAKVRAAHKK